MKLGLISLGCPKNLVDSEVMLGIIEKYKIEITNDPEEAEIIIVNTCGFIESAKQESIETILSMSSYKTDGCCNYLIVTGCLAQRYAQELFADMPEVDAIVGTNVYKDIAAVIDCVMQGQRVECPVHQAVSVHQQKDILQGSPSVHLLIQFLHYS